MVGQLNSSEIEDLLHKQIVGRIGCHDKDIVYVVPISYAYDDNKIYCHAYEGKKLEIMRKNPKVCFQIDEMKDMGNWKSVIAWGDFEELVSEQERNKALLILLRRPLPFLSSVTTHLGEDWPFSSREVNKLNNIQGIVFRISLKEKTGKFENMFGTADKTISTLI
jgi:nitroimidazol reductase NimA-like FMN-containing flavoprotein (pyridoxamine 5'-phosphate oxidase superfamily)